jgi:prepilin-type N-terminal cleavage/methylation domain-containing protein
VKLIRNRLARNTDPEAGLTLLEVIIAMMIFAVVAAGVAFVMVSSLSTTRDARAREVATNLAAQDIDYTRSVDDVIDVVDKVTTTTIGGITYTVTRTTAWITSSGADATCGASGGVLLYKHVNDRVTWTGARTPQTKVQADTQIAPNGRLNDQSLGTILVSVLSSSGIGVSGVSVTATPDATAPNGAQVLTTTPDATDVQGCSYILKVVPGTYAVSISKSGGYISGDQSTSPSQTVTVVAGDSTTANFQYDLASSFATTFASNSALTPIQFPKNLIANYASTNATYSPVSATIPATKLLTVPLFPVSSGYTVFAGSFVASSKDSSGVAQPSCLSPDPAMWAANAASVTGSRTPSVGTNPGMAGALSVRMGVVTATVAKDLYLTAVPAVAATSVIDPGCDPKLKLAYSFATKTTATPVNLALPFGTFQLYSGATAGATTTLIASSAIALPAGSPANTAAGVFTLDPRVIP